MNYTPKVTFKECTLLTLTTVIFIYLTALSFLIPWIVLLIPTSLILLVFTGILIYMTVLGWISHVRDPLPRNSPTGLGGILHNREEEDPF